jgi:hypothetical protein
VASTFLLTALALILVMALTVGLVAVVAIRAAVRRNRVHPDIETGVPLAWSWWPGAPARYHRRLRAAVSRITLPPTRRGIAAGFRRGARPAPGQPGAGHLGLALVTQAAMLDHELLVASRLPPPARRAVLRSRQRDVFRIERLGRSFRREGLAAIESPLPPCDADRDAVLDAVELRLRHLREAHDELGAVEADATMEARAVPAYPPGMRAAG